MNRRPPPGEPSEQVEWFFRRMVGDAAWERLPEAERQARQADGPALVADLLGFTGAAPFEVTALAVPTVFGRGGPQSAQHHRATVAWLAGHVPGAELVEIEAAQHGAHLTHPDAFATLVRVAVQLGRPAPLRTSVAKGDGAEVKVLLSGSHGLIGRALATRLTAEGHGVVRLRQGGASCGGRGRTSEPSPGILETTGWTGDALDRHGPYEALVHLAGAGIGDRRWSAARRREILASRVGSTDLIARLAARLDPRPGVLVSASAVGYYGDRGDEVLTEESTPGEGFLADVCRAWESATAPGRRRPAGRAPADRHRPRPHGGALARQLPIFRLGLGGRLGSGRQYLSWITLDDHVSIVRRALDDDRLVGPVNATAPSPVTNAEFTRALGRALHRPAGLAVPRPALAAVVGAQRSRQLLLASQRALPGRLTAVGHRFAHPDIERALASVLTAVG